MGYNNKVWNGVTYEMSLSSKRYFRRVYGIMDFLAEMGGLFGAFGSLSLAIVVGINYFGSYQFVMAELFYDRFAAKDKRPSNTKQYIGRKKANKVQWRAIETLILNLYTFAPKICFSCCKPSRSNKLKRYGFKQTLEEANIVYIIQQIRILKAAVKSNYTL